jgi:hypothetical protein
MQTGSSALHGAVEEQDSTEDACKKMWAGQPNILVAVRVRPLLKHDRIQKGIVKVLDRKVRRKHLNRYTIQRAHYGLMP